LGVSRQLKAHQAQNNAAEDSCRCIHITACLILNDCVDGAEKRRISPAGIRTRMPLQTEKPGLIIIPAPPASWHCSDKIWQ
jgi:hypothetical protein